MPVLLCTEGSGDLKGGKAVSTGGVKYNFKEMVRLAVILAIFAGMAAAALTWTNQKTAGVIEERQQQELARTLQVVLPDAEQFVEVEKEGAKFYVGKKAGKEVGVVIQAEGSGYGGPVKLLVGVTMEGRIVAVAITELLETPGIGTKVNDDSFLGQFIGKNTGDPVTLGQDINAISGATISSRAVASAVKNALTRFGVAFLGQEAPQDDVIDITKLADGTYLGEGQGFQSKIKVAVRVEGGRIVDIDILSHGDTPGISDAAFNTVPEAIIAKQSVEVDAASGATFSSQGIMEAVKNALASEPTAGPVPAEPEEPEKPAIDISKLKDGRYEGEAKGFLSTVRVAVTVSGGKITAVEVLSHGDTQGIADNAISKIPGAIVASQSIDVDVVSGATGTSKGIIEAVRAALSSEPKTVDKPTPLPGPVSYKDGTYEGEGKGFGGTIRVSVTVSGGKITRVEVLAHSETPGISDKAIEQIPAAIVSAQSADVDAVSGATFTSNGIKDAVVDALSRAR